MKYVCILVYNFAIMVIGFDFGGQEYAAKILVRFFVSWMCFFVRECFISVSLYPGRLYSADEVPIQGVQSDGPSYNCKFYHASLACRLVSCHLDWRIKGPELLVYGKVDYLLIVLEKRWRKPDRPLPRFVPDCNSSQCRTFMATYNKDPQFLLYLHPYVGLMMPSLCSVVGCHCLHA
jgi:hypothetical protein